MRWNKFCNKLILLLQFSNIELSGGVCYPIDAYIFSFGVVNEIV